MESLKRGMYVRDGWRGGVHTSTCIPAEHFAFVQGGAKSSICGDTRTENTMSSWYTCRRNIVPLRRDIACQLVVHWKGKKCIMQKRWEPQIFFLLQLCPLPSYTWQVSIDAHAFWVGRIAHQWQLWAGPDHSINTARVKCRWREWASERSVLCRFSGFPDMSHRYWAGLVSLYASRSPTHLPPSLKEAKLYIFLITSISQFKRRELRETGVVPPIHFSHCVLLS